MGHACECGWPHGMRCGYCECCAWQVQVLSWPGSLRLAEPFLSQILPFHHARLLYARPAATPAVCDVQRLPEPSERPRPKFCICAI